MSTLKTGCILISLSRPHTRFVGNNESVQYLTTVVTFAVVAFAVVVLITGDFDSVGFIICSSLAV